MYKYYYNNESTDFVDTYSLRHAGWSLISDLWPPDPVVSVHQNYVGCDSEKEPFLLSVVVTDANNHNVPQYRAIMWQKTVSSHYCWRAVIESVAAAVQEPLNLVSTVITDNAERKTRKQRPGEHHSNCFWFNKFETNHLHVQIYLLVFIFWFPCACTCNLYFIFFGEMHTVRVNKFISLNLMALPLCAHCSPWMLHIKLTNICVAVTVGYTFQITLILENPRFDYGQFPEGGYVESFFMHGCLLGMLVPFYAARKHWLYIVNYSP